MDGQATVWLYDTEPPDRDGATTALQVCAEFGLLDEAFEPLVPSDLPAGADAPMDLHWEGPDATGSVTVRLRWEGYADGEDLDSIVGVSAVADQIVPDDGNDAEGYTGFPAAFVELIRRLALAFDPEVGTSYNTQHFHSSPSPRDVIPEETPIEFDRLPWLGVYSENIVDQFGGLEHVLASPAWRVEELDNGSILVIKTREPWADRGTTHPIDRHLLG